METTHTDPKRLYHRDIMEQWLIQSRHKTEKEKREREREREQNIEEIMNEPKPGEEDGKRREHANKENEERKRKIRGEEEVVE